jgi:formylglycine-generating enzyme required for sulfatase activity
LKTHPAGGKKPNAFGLYDMHGNVYEWCMDWYGDSYADLTAGQAGAKIIDPTGPASGTYRVLRGGSWGRYPRDCRSANRGRNTPGSRGYYIGFRVAVDLEAADTPPPAARGLAGLEEASRLLSLSSWPAEPAAMSVAQRAEVSKALDAVKQALALRPADADALALKAKIEKYLPKPEKPPPRELTLDLGDGVSIKLVLLPAGKFMMGSPEDEKDRNSSEGPHREVTISKPFYLGALEVTQEQYELVIGTNPSRFKDAKNPVDSVSWHDAGEFCRKLSQMTGKTVSLPTEAQWEYACRAGTKTRFSFGENDAALGDYAWYVGNSGSKTHSAGGKKPNAFGLYDMHGNVWERCSDSYGSYEDLPAGQAGAKIIDPTGPDTGTFRVLRGGSWYGSPQHCRSASRLRDSPAARYGLIGFRVAVHLK